MTVETFNPARSTFVTQIEYDDEIEDLTVTFTDGKAFTYHGVSKSTYRNFTLAPSVGGFFYRHIRDSYDFDEV